MKETLATQELLTELASDGLDISSIINQPRASAASGQASPSEVTEWDEDVNVLIEEEPQDTETMPIEEDGQSEILMMNPNRKTHWPE